MTRVKRGTTANKRRRNVLALTKGYRFGRKSKERMAKEAIRHAGSYAFRDRRKKKGDFRQLWTIRLNAALRTSGLTYSKFIGTLKSKDVEINRKMLSEIAMEKPETFERILEAVK
jgi:large subunit ribosomal protein L20